MGLVNHYAVNHLTREEWNENLAYQKQKAIYKIFIYTVSKKQCSHCFSLAIAPLIFILVVDKINFDGLYSFLLNVVIIWCVTSS